MSDWLNPPESIENYFGFVYKITKLNPKENEKYYYIGCKQFNKRVKRKPLKGKTRNRIDHKESDWKEYWGSSKELLTDIEKYGKESYKREILHLCSCKWELKYLEMKEQMIHNVLLDPLSYNGIVNIRLGSVPKGLVEQKEKYQIHHKDP